MTYLSPNIVVVHPSKPPAVTWRVSIYVRSPDHLLLLAARGEVDDQDAALAFARRYRLRASDPVFGYPITEIEIVPVRTRAP